jgi:ATP-dependent NAD(P)H-hydrate dehydratase
MVSIIKKEVGLEELRALLPKLAGGRHKGQNGKIAIIGGSFEYTGAPYYGAAAALRGGGDLSHIFCTEKAATPIKSYSPEIIVHPYLLCQEEIKRQVKREEVDECIKAISKWYDPLHGVAIGSGLGRDDAVALVLEDLYTNLKDLVTVCDGDFFYFLAEKNKENLAEKIRKRSRVTVLTPNKVEFKRLWKLLKGDAERTSEEEIQKEKEKIVQAKSPVVEVAIDNPMVRDQVEIANRLHHVNLLEKGEFDIITNGKQAFVVLQSGCFKRCGGQGDVLAGLTTLYCYWDQLRQEKENIKPDNEAFNLLKGCMLASYITRKAAARAYEKYKYGLTTPNLLDEVPETINNLAPKL